MTMNELFVRWFVESERNAITGRKRYVVCGTLGPDSEMVRIASFRSRRRARRFAAKCDVIESWEPTTEHTV